MKVPYLLVTLAQAMEAVDSGTPLFADTETKGLYGEIRLLQLYQKDWDHVLIVDTPNPYELTTFLSSNHNIWHNVHYDVSTVQQQTETRWQPPVYDDTFLLSRLAFPEKEKFSLDDVLKYCLGYDPYLRQKLDKKTLQKSDWSKPVLTEAQLQYAATDVYFMPQVWDNVSELIDDPSYKLDKLTLNYCFDFQWNGMPLNEERLFLKYEDIEAQIAAVDMPINVNSWQQVRPYIGEDESDDLALAKFALAGNERAENVRKVRKLRKQLSFLTKFEETVVNGYILGKFLPSTRSGRLASKDQNLQQLPRSLKDVFGYDEDGDRVLIYADYAQLELRTICAIVKCVLMEQLFRDGTDLHTYTADMLFGQLQDVIIRTKEAHPSWSDDKVAEYAAKEYKRNRQISKTCNFSLVYGGGIPMFIGILIKTANIFMEEGPATKTRSRWRNLWREIYRWQEKGIRDWKAGRLGSTPLGRKYKAKMMTDQLNIENQGAGAEVAKLALHYFYPELQKYDDCKLCNFIHDSFIISAPNDPAVYQPLARQLAESMQEAWFEMSKLFTVPDLPMPVNVKVGFNWGDIESDDVEDLWSYDLEPYAMLEKVQNA